MGSDTRPLITDGGGGPGRRRRCTNVRETRPVNRILALCLATLLAIGLTAGIDRAGAKVGSTDTTYRPTAHGDRTTYHPAVIRLSAPEIPNPTRGIYRWLGVPVTPKGWPWRDVYYRDAVNWEEIEPAPGRYDFNAFREGLREAGRRHGRFGFRVMAYCPGCGNDVAPPFLPRQGDTGVIAWNDGRVLSAWERLMAALGSEFGDDPRLGWIDVGGYGSWGEWHSFALPEGTGRITDASALRFVDAVLDAFPGKHVVINTVDRHLVTMTVRHRRRLGLRADCLGEDRWPLVPGVPVLRRRWRSQPFVSEWCDFAAMRMTTGLRQVRRLHVSMVSSGNFPVPYAQQSPAEQAAYRLAAKRSGYRYVVRRLSVPTTWTGGTTATVRIGLRNAGSAPTYDTWRPSLQWRRGGTLVAESPLPLDLRRVLPGRHSYRLRVPVPTDIDGPDYRLGLIIEDPSGYFPPLRLANRGRLPDGAYAIR